MDSQTRVEQEPSLSILTPLVHRLTPPCSHSPSSLDVFLHQCAYHSILAPLSLSLSLSLSTYIYTHSPLPLPLPSPLPLSVSISLSLSMTSINGT